MKPAEIIFFVFSIIGVLLKFANLPLSGPLLTIGFTGLAFYYFPFSKYSIKDSNINKNFNALIIGSVFNICMLSVLFNLQYWPGYQFLSISGITGSVILFFTLNANNKYKRIKSKNIVLGIITIIIFAIPIGFQLKLQHLNDPELARLKELSYTNPKKTEYREKLESYLSAKRKEANR